MSDINKKSTPDQMRVLLKRMREGKYDANEPQEQPKKNLGVRDMLKITRRLHEEEEIEKRNASNLKNVYDQPAEEKKFMDYFNDINISVKFKPLDVYENLVLWDGVVDGIIEFIYSVTPYDDTSKVTFDYLEGYSPDNPKTAEIIERIKTYYEYVFKPYWLENVIQK